MNYFERDKIEALIDIGETHKMEFKRDFDWENPVKQLKYLKAIVGLCNHEGGYLILGVDDQGEKIGGIDKDSFEKLDNAKITDAINKYFSPSGYKFYKVNKRES